MNEEVPAWVLWHRYSDGSATHVLRVYLNEARGREDMALMDTASDLGMAGEWRLESVRLLK